MADEPARARYEYLPVGQHSDGELVDMCTAYFDDEAADYDAFDCQVQRRRRYLAGVERYAAGQLSGLKPCDRILSFGCGTGRREKAIAALTPHDPVITGVERSAAMRSLAASRGLAVTADLPAGDGFFDAVLCLYSFIHLPSAACRRTVLAALAAALRPGGLLIIDVFNLNDRFEWASKLADGGSGQRPPLSGPHQGDVLYRRAGRPGVSFMHYFTVGEITGLLEEAGLVICDLTGVGHGHQPGTAGVPLDAGCLLLTCGRR